MEPFFTRRDQKNAGLRPTSFARKWLAFLRQDSKEQEEGQGLVEYALVLLLVALVVITALIVLGPQIGSIFSAVSKGFS
jgi:pilus assembly protein Flp/PilA